MSDSQSRLLRRVERRRQLVRLLPLVPPVALFLAIYGYPLVQMGITSLFDPDFTLRHYRHVLLTPVYLRVLLLTLRLALTVTMTSLVIGYPAAYLLATVAPSQARLLLGLVLLPFWISSLVRNYAWTILLARNGLVNQLLMVLGVVTDPLALMFNFTGVVIGMTYILVPFMILALYSVMTGIDRQLLTAAASLGAAPRQVFARVFLPLTLPGITAGSLLVFIMGVGFFITPALLGGGRVPTIATLIEAQMRGVLNWGLGSALSVVLLVVILGLFAIYTRLVGSAHLLGVGAPR